MRYVFGGIDPVRSPVMPDAKRGINNEADLLLAPSSTIKTSLTSNGVDEKHVQFLPREQALEKLGITILPTDTLIGGITEFTKNKGVQYLISAAKDLPDSVHLAFIGEGEEKGLMEKLAKNIGLENRVHFLGFKENPAQYLKAFDIFVFPSLKEGLPYAILEAGLAELPIIASNVGGIPDIITDGEDGILVPPKDVQALSEAIKKVLADKELGQRLGKNASEKIKQHFNFEKMLEKTMDIYK